MLKAIPYDKSCGVSFSIEAISIDREENIRDVKKKIQKHILSRFRASEMPDAMMEDELANYDFFLVPQHIYEIVDRSMDQENPISFDVACQITTAASNLYKSFDVRRLAEART